MRPHSLILVLIAATAAAGAQNLPGNSNPNGFAADLLGSFTLFAANDQTAGMELWRLDHATQAVALVCDIRPGPFGSDPRDLTPFLGGYVFSAYERATGVELWRSDGTTVGTELAADLHDTGSSLPRRLTVVGNRLFFAADNGTDGVELWSYDGATATMLADINPFGDSQPRDLVACGGVLLFTADDGIHGREPWRSDGTAAGTSLVKDIDPIGGSGARGFATIGGIAMFAASDGNSGSELWRTDGTTAGTWLVRDIQPGSDGSAPGEFHGQFRVFFAATTIAHGRELWMTDGTTGGTVLVNDVNPGPAGSHPRDLVAASFWDFWFVADDAGTGRELWQCLINGTGLVRKTDLVAGPGSVEPRDLVFTGSPNRLVFTDSSGDPRLWGTDGSAAGASPLTLTSFRLGPIALTANRTAQTPTNVLFVADDGVTGLEPWRTDGTVAGTTLVADIAPLPAPGVQPLLDGHVDTSGTLVSTCIENGHANGLGIVAFGPSPGPPLLLPGLIDGPLLLSSILATFPLLLDITGTACFSFVLPTTIVSGDLLAQGFSAGASLPFEVTDLVAIARTTESTTSLFGGDVKTTGTFNDEDHRYEVSVQLPPLPTTGPHPSGTFVFRHRFGYSADIWLMDLEKHEYSYDGETTSLFFSGTTPLVKNVGLELWFVADTGEETRLWRSYC